jgi:hypothetical protein
VSACGGAQVVTITAGLIGNGSDVTSVTLCGIPALILQQSNVSVVVRAGYNSDPRGIAGDVVVTSTSEGTQTLPNGFKYMPRTPGGRCRATVTHARLRSDHGDLERHMRRERML